MRHIRTKHKDTPEHQAYTQSLITDHTTKSLAKYSVNSIKKKELDRACALLIAQDMRPIRIVEGTGFRKLVTLLDPRYQLPCARSLRTKIIPTLREEEKKKMMDDLHHANWAAVTTVARFTNVKELFLT
jgi:hypothetical protein